MSGTRRKPRSIRQADWNVVASPPLSPAKLKKLRPLKDVMPDLVEAVRKSRGRPRLDHPKQLVSLRLDADVVEVFKEEGPGWQTRMNDVLARWAKRRSRAA